MSVLLRAVLDTNVWISSELYEGNPWRCIQAARAGRVQLYYCAPMLAELATKLREHFGYPENHIHAVVYEYRRLSTEVVISGALKVVAADPTDDKFIECALVAGASYLVSGDHHLLALRSHQGVTILTAAAFLALLETM
jgi:uncharacterized protein